jgi:hypothetical protein
LQITIVFNICIFLKTPLISCVLISQNCTPAPDWPQWICQRFYYQSCSSVSFLSWEHQWVLIQPGYLRPLLPDSAPAEPETVEDVFAGKASRWPSQPFWDGTILGFS